jgi:hypothetical protein
MIPTGNVVISQAPIGTPLSSRPNPSLPPGYRAMNDFVSITTQVPSKLLVPPGYNVVVGFVPTPAQVLSGGLYVPPPPLPRGSGPSGANPVGGTYHSFTFGYQILVGGQSPARGNLNLGVKLKLGYNLNLGGNLRLESITFCMDKMHLDHNPTCGTFFPKEIHNRLGGNILKLTLLYPLTSFNHISIP